MKGKVVLVKFPFDDLSSSKVRPTVEIATDRPDKNHVTT